MIFDEFWADVPGGLTVTDLVAHLQTAASPGRIPLSLIALDGAKLIGTINLIDNDDARRPHLWPWLAALVVRQDWRGRGVGTRLVRELLVEAAAMKLPALYFGTDGPDFYLRLGAKHHEQVNPDFWVMRFDLPG